MALGMRPPPSNDECGPWEAGWPDYCKHVLKAPTAVVGGPPGYPIGVKPRGVVGIDPYYPGSGQMLYVYTPHARKWGKGSIETALKKMIAEAVSYGSLAATLEEKALMRRQFFMEAYGASDVKAMQALYGLDDPDWGYHNPSTDKISAMDYTAPAPAAYKQEMTDALNGAIERTTMNRRDVIEANLRKLQAELAVLDRFPKDTFDNGTVIKFSRVFGGTWEELKDVDNTTVYTYVGIKVNGKWCLSGNTQRNTWYSWAELTEWLGESVGVITTMVSDKVIVAAQGSDIEDSQTVGLSADGEDEKAVDLTPDPDISKTTF